MNAIEMADNYKKKLEENKKNYIANIVSNDKRNLNDIVDSYITSLNNNRNSSYYKNEYKNEINKRNQLQKNIQKSTYEKGVQTTVTPFSTQRNILPIQEQTEITKNKRFEVTAGQDKLGQNKSIENKYQEIKKSNEYKNQMKQLEEQSNEVGYAKYNYDKQRIAEDDIGWYDKSIGRLTGGIGSLFDYNGGLIKNENGDLEYLPTFNQMKHQKVKESYKTGIGRFVGDVLYESGKIAGSTLVNQVLPGVGSTMYFGKMFVDSTNQAISEGYDSGSATVYGLINVGLEYATGKMLGSATKGLTGGKTSSYEKLLNKTFSKVIKKPKIASILANAGSEATEEFIQEYLDNLTKLAVLEKSTDIKDYGSVFTNEDILADALYSAAIGGVTGGVIGTMSGENTNVDNNDVNLYDTFKKELEETKENTTNKDTINKIDTIISSIDNNINNDSNINDNVDTITSQINEYEALKEQNKITKEQEIELNNLKEQLNAIQNQNTDTSTSSKAEVNLPTVQDIVDMENRQKSNLDLPIFNNTKPNVELSLKEQQNSIIQNSNPVEDNYHTWIRSANDIKTFEETLNDSDYKEYFEAGEDFDETYTAKMAREALETGKITVYSSYPIEQGIFVSPSKMEAESYSGNGKIYSKEVNLTDVAWIDPTQGQYAKVYDILPTKYSQSTKEWNDYLKENFPSSGTKTKMSDIKLPVREDIESSSKKNKILNPNEISKLTKEDANTTPILPKRGSANKVNDGNSHFAKNIKDKVNMLNVEQKAEILSKEEVRYYDKVTNKESLEKAFKRINDGGSSEALRWFNTKAKDMDATDVAEGWILLKQYADNGDYDSMVEVAKKMREIGTTAGQTVQAFNIMERMTPEGMVKYAQSELSEAYDRMVKNKSKEWIDKHREDFDLKPDEVKFIMDTMKEVSKMEDGYDKKVKLAEIQKLMTDKLPPEKGAKIRSWMRISMLFNPKTQVRNVAGNALIMPINSFGDLFSSYADKLIAKKTGVRTTGTTNIKAILKGIKKGAYEATNDYKKGINTKDMEGNRFEISDGKSFSEKNLMGRTLNRTESLLNYVMDVGDRVFSEAAFENSLQNQLVLNNTTEITQEMIDIAHQEALSRTWNDNNNYTKFVLGVRKGLNKLNINGYGLGDVLIPFAKTPANLTKAIVDYSPAGLVSTIIKGINLKRSLTNGQYTATMQHEFVQSLGKATAGTMLYVLGIALAKAGITSGDSDDDKDTANFLKNTLGINSYSIKIGGKSFTYDWAQPLAAPLSITANVVNSKNSDSKALLEGIVGSLDSAGSILLEQSFLQSINDVLNDNDGVVSGIINEILELPARAVPTFSKQIADLVDGTQRTSFEYGKPIQSAINSIKAKIPFVSKTLNPSVDTMGREIQKYGGKNNIFNVFLNPANVSTENISESAEEIYRLYKETGETNIMPRVAPYYINQKGEKITMTGEERTKYQKISGMIIEDSVNKLLKNNDYQQLNNTEKADIINKIVNYSYNKAREEVLGIEMSNEYNKINSYVDDGGNVADYYLNKKEIDYSYSNPGKYKTITQITSYNDYLSYKENIDTIKEKFTNSSQRKAAVIKYVNSLDLTIPQKAMLIKMNYSSYNNYNNQIINYINKQSISLEDKKEILEELGFKVRNGKVYTK